MLNLYSQKVYSLLAECFLSEGVILVTYFLSLFYLFTLHILYSIDEKIVACTTNGRVRKLIQDVIRDTKD